MTNAVWKFRLSSLFIWTTVLGVLLAMMRDVPLEGMPVLLIVIAPPLTCLPMLLDRWLYRDDRGLAFSIAQRIWLVLAVALYSILALMLATFAFAPDWKGEKGLHPLFYIHDYPAGVTIWPIYFVGSGSFVRAVLDPNYARRSAVNLLMIATVALISVWFTLSVLFLKFAGDAKMLAFVPGSVGVCYCVYCGVLLKHADIARTTWRNGSIRLSLWFGATLASLVAKYPLAKKLYDELPNEPPPDCFIVTAASRGTPRWVGSWWDPNRGRVLNRQLLLFWEFEAWLRRHRPHWHRRIRSVYNRIGPLLARQIRFRWQANLVFLLLKPVEWLAGCCLRTDSAPSPAEPGRDRRRR